MLDKIEEVVSEANYFRHSQLDWESHSGFTPGLKRFPIGVGNDVLLLRQPLFCAQLKSMLFMLSFLAIFRFNRNSRL